MRFIYLTTAATALILSACNSGGTTYISAKAPSAAQITVSATGEVSQVPDRASVSAGVVTQAPTADAAMSANAEKMSATFDQLRAAGIKKENIRTSQMSLTPRYNYQNRQNRQNRTITGYEVRNTVSATSEDRDKVGPMLDALVKAGVNNINGVNFSINEPEAAKTEAREKAVKAAKAKAEAMASAAGVSLGKLTSISENSRGGFRPQPLAYAARASADIASSTPIAAGEQNLSVTVNLTYEIKN